MRNTLLTTATLFSVMLAAPAFSQSAPTPDATTASPDQPTATAPDGSATPAAPRHHHHRKAASGDDADQKFAHEPGTGESGPASMKASNIEGSDSRSEIAPHLPMPKAGHDATADAYLGAAERALTARRTGEAQQALEMAETRLLDRSTPATDAGQPTQDPETMQVTAARKALGRGDMKAAHAAIQAALTSAPAGGMTPASAPMGAPGMAPTDNGAMGHGPMGNGMSGGLRPTNTAPTGSPMMAPNGSGAGPVPGASAGASTGGGTLGTGTADNPAGAK